ncbi:MAG: hypothetical protein ACI8RD_011398 [Bacillariaceae sp.]|jgi:hypothetical protein
MHTSLRAALSQVFSFELAEEGVNSDWVSKPITCISYAAPRSGTSGYRTAVKARMTKNDLVLKTLTVHIH